MLATVAYRGPDDERYALLPGIGVGFRRLAIVDPEHGHQPMATPDGRLTLVCNGEIYNHRELRALLSEKGFAFRTQCDSEVLLHAYDEWGAALVERLRGIFAFALWDARAATLLLGRDRSGVKPLFVREQGDELIFGSEAKAVLAHPTSIRRLDPVGCFAPAEPGALLEGSPFEGVQQLGAGCTLTFAAEGGLRPHRYWSYAPSTDAGGDEAVGNDPIGTDAVAAWIARFREELLRVVPMELMADVPIGACLSGGLDSSVVAAIAARHAPGLPTFTSVCAGSEDPWFAFGVAHAARLDPHFVRFEPDELLAELPIVAWGAEGAFDLGFVSRAQLAVSARNHGLKVLLSGQGADELMGGYDGSYAALAASADRALAAARLLDSGSADLASALRHRASGSDEDAAVEARNVAEHLGRQHAGLGPYLLRFEDRMGMLAGVEIRVPLLDHRLVEICASLPAHSRRVLFDDKRLLRDASLGLVPDSVRLRQKLAFNSHLPPMTQVLARTKHDGLAAELMTERMIHDKGYFDPREVKRAQQAANYRLLDAVLIVQLLDELFVASFEPTRFAQAPAPPTPDVTVDASWMPVEMVRTMARKGPSLDDTPAVRDDIVYVGVLERVQARGSDESAASTMLGLRFNDGRHVLMSVPEALGATLVAAFLRQADGARGYAALATAIDASSETVLAIGRFAAGKGLLHHEGRTRR
jgi:asparagine synthase (glutamine-hydrolysing)